MQKHGIKDIRNTVLLSHGGAGKTSISEAILFTAGAINRLGKVDEGSTTSDYDPDEMKRKMSINLSILPYEWKNIKVNLLDAPGYADFIGDIKAGIRVSEGAVIVVCAASGVEVGTQQVWGYCQEEQIPRIFFVNKMDRENADFLRTVDQIQARFGPKCVPAQLPIGAHTGFQGLIDLLTMKAYAGSPLKETELPGDLQSQASSLREKLVEAIAEVDDALLEKYLGGEEIGLEDLTKTLREAVVSGKVFPIFAGSGLQNVGMNTLMDAICEYLPSPEERETTTEGGGTLKPSESGSLSALVFKTSADPYVGKLTYFKVYTGAMDSNSQVWNANRSAAERVGQLYMIRGKTQETVQQVIAGDIGAVAKLGVTGTGDTLCQQNSQVKITPISFPPPIFSEAIHPKSKADIDKIGTALTRLTEEDPTLQVRRELDTSELIISGMGDTHLEVTAEKMLRKFGVSVELAIPKVPYKETITTSAKAEHKHKKQSGGHGQYGHVMLELEPLARDAENEFAERVVGGSVPKNYIPAVEKGVKEASQEGSLAGYPVIGVKATLYDGSFHPVDSSEICFKIAGSQALKKGMAEAHPILLEPIMFLRVNVPGDLTGDIIGDLNTKRARVLGINPDGDRNIIEAEVPLDEVQRYAIDLKSMTQGRAVYTLEFQRYEEVPAQITQKIISERQAQKQAEKS
jgi:elongation factor G